MSVMSLVKVSTYFTAFCMQNVLHRHHTGCEASFHREMAILLPDFSIESWYQHQEPLYRMGSVEFSEQSSTHVPITPTTYLMEQQGQQKSVF